MENINYEIGRKIKFYRKKNKISQKVLSENLNISRSNIAMIETGKINITIAILYNISNILNINILRLLPLNNIKCKTCGENHFRDYKCKTCGTIDPLNYYN